MFCPGCGAEERQRSQFCRVCGGDLRGARAGLEHPGSITEATLTAREEIGRSVALKIREVQSGKDLQHIATHVLPQITEFLRSPEEMRLRRIRAGLISSSVGISAAVLFLIVFMVTWKAGFLIGSAIGLVPFLVGISIVLNGVYFSSDRAVDEKEQVKEREKNLINGRPAVTARKLSGAVRTAGPASVTEHTTHHLPQS